MRATWWPVTVVLLAAPFVTWGFGWVDRARLVAEHGRELTAAAQRAEKQRAAAYNSGKADATAELRAGEQSELEKTKKALADMEAELAAERQAAAEKEAKRQADPGIEIVKVAPAKAVPPDIIEACRKSKSCRERAKLK